MYTQDTDSSVREATATAFGLIAANLEASQSSFCTGDTSSNPVLRAIFESLGAQQKEVDLAASQALSKVCGWWIRCDFLLAYLLDCLTWIRMLQMMSA